MIPVYNVWGLCVRFRRVCWIVTATQNGGVLGLRCEVIGWCQCIDNCIDRVSLGAVSGSLLKPPPLESSDAAWGSWDAYSLQLQMSLFQGTSIEEVGKTWSYRRSTRYDERTGELGLEKERARLVKVAISVSPSLWWLSRRFPLQKDQISVPIRQTSLSQW